MRIQDAIRQLRDHREHVDAAIVAIEGLTGLRRKPASRSRGSQPRRGKRRVPAAARRPVGAAQRARPAKIRGRRPKRKISPEGRRRISEGVRARWEATRKAHAGSVAPMRLLSKKEIAAMQQKTAKAAKATKAR
jgi:hypothetical protein